MSVATNKLFPVLPADQQSLVKNFWRGYITEEKYFEEMKAHGLNQENAEAYRNANFTLLDSQQLLTLWRRKLLAETPQENDELFFSKMEAIGFNETIARQFTVSEQVFESPQQIVTFLVREVLTPDLRKELELDKEFPEPAIKLFKQIGIGEELARNIWAAHWELPDVQTLNIAFHRYSKENREFWEDEVKAQNLDPDKVQTSVEDISRLLKFKDVGTRYREQVLSTLFSDAGQIQLRWLIRFGFINFREAVYRHERQGLPKVIAEQVAKVVFVVQSITDWRTAIKHGVMTFDDVKTKMAEWQITEENIVSIVKLKVAPSELEALSEERALSKSIIRDAWLIGENSRSETITLLTDIGYSEDQSKLIFEIWQADEEIKAKKAAKRGQLTKGEIKKGFRKGKFTAAQAIEELVKVGMNKQSATLLIEIEGLALA